MNNLHDGSKDFDFLIGRWQVKHRRLKGRLTGASDWETFSSVCEVRTIFGGAGNMDETLMHAPMGSYYGMTLRLYQPASRQWHLHWADSKTGSLFAPMIGAFVDGIGRFYAHEANNGVLVYSRFIWSGITADSCHWEQALSPDGGATWETNWTMAHTRVHAPNG